MSSIREIVAQYSRGELSREDYYAALAEAVENKGSSSSSSSSNLRLGQSPGGSSGPPTSREVRGQGVQGSSSSSRGQTKKPKQGYRRHAEYDERGGRVVSEYRPVMVFAPDPREPPSERNDGSASEVRASSAREVRITGSSLSVREGGSAREVGGTSSSDAREGSSSLREDASSSFRETRGSSAREIGDGSAIDRNRPRSKGYNIEYNHGGKRPPGGRRTEGPRHKEFMVDNDHEHTFAPASGGGTYRGHDVDNRPFDPLRLYKHHTETSRARAAQGGEALLEEEEEGGSATSGGEIQRGRRKSPKHFTLSEEKNCTFSPVIKGARPGSPGGGARLTLLGDSGVAVPHYAKPARSKSPEENKHEFFLESEEKNCTFAPKISSRAQKYEMPSFQDRLQAWTAKSAEKKKRLMEKAKENEDMLIAAANQKHRRPHVLGGDPEALGRSMHDSQVAHKELIRDYVRRKHGGSTSFKEERQEAENCTFQPDLKSSKTSLKKLRETGVSVSGGNRGEKMSQRGSRGGSAVGEQSDGGVSGGGGASRRARSLTPDANVVVANILKHGRGNASRFARRTRNNPLAVKPHQDHNFPDGTSTLTAAAAVASNAENTFRPRVNPIHSDMQAAQLYLANDVFTRLTEGVLYHDQTLSDKRLEAERNDTEWRRHLKFQDDINALNPEEEARFRAIIDARHGPKPETEGPNWFRIQRFLWHQNLCEERRLLNLQDLEKVYKTPLQSVPQMSGGSRYLAEKMALSYIRPEEEGRKGYSWRTAKAVAAEFRECTFKPEISERGKNVEGRNLGVLYDDAAKRRERRKELEKKHDVMEVEGLTFRPKLSEFARTKGQKVINTTAGLDEYLSQLQKKDERVLLTRQQFLKKAEAQQKQECPFAPNLHHKAGYVPKTTESSLNTFKLYNELRTERERLILEKTHQEKEYQRKQMLGGKQMDDGRGYGVYHGSEGGLRRLVMGAGGSLGTGSDQGSPHREALDASRRAKSHPKKQTTEKWAPGAKYAPSATAHNAINKFYRRSSSSSSPPASIGARRTLSPPGILKAMNSNDNIDSNININSQLRGPSDHRSSGGGNLSFDKGRRSVKHVPDLHLERMKNLGGTSQTLGATATASTQPPTSTVLSGISAAKSSQDRPSRAEQESSNRQTNGALSRLSNGGSTTNGGAAASGKLRSPSPRSMSPQLNSMDIAPAGVDNSVSVKSGSTPVSGLSFDHRHLGEKGGEKQEMKGPEKLIHYRGNMIPVNSFINPSGGGEKKPGPNRKSLFNYYPEAGLAPVKQYARARGEDSFSRDELSDRGGLQEGASKDEENDYSNQLLGLCDELLGGSSSSSSYEFPPSYERRSSRDDRDRGAYTPKTPQEKFQAHSQQAAVSYSAAVENLERITKAYAARNDRMERSLSASAKKR